MPLRELQTASDSSSNFQYIYTVHGVNAISLYYAKRVFSRLHSSDRRNCFNEQVSKNDDLLRSITITIL